MYKKQGLEKLDFLAINKGSADQSRAWWIDELYVNTKTLEIVVLKATNTLKYFKNGRTNMHTIKSYDVIKVDTIENGYINEAEGSMFGYKSKKDAKAYLKTLITEIKGD